MARRARVHQGAKWQRVPTICKPPWQVTESFSRWGQIGGVRGILMRFQCAVGWMNLRMDVKATREPGWKWLLQALITKPLVPSPPSLLVNCRFWSFLINAAVACLHLMPLPSDVAAREAEGAAACRRSVLTSSHYANALCCFLIDPRREKPTRASIECARLLLFTKGGKCRMLTKVFACHLQSGRAETVCAASRGLFNTHTTFIFCSLVTVKYWHYKTQDTRDTF